MNRSPGSVWVMRLGFILESEQVMNRTCGDCPFSNCLKSSNLPKYYFNLTKALKSYQSNDTPYTPAVSLIFGLKEAVDCILKEGMEKRWLRFEKLAYATREAALSLGLGVFSKSPSASVTAIWAPEGIKSTDIVKTLRKEHGISIAAGQDDVKDKILRIAHMGWINDQDLKRCFSYLEKVLQQLGYDFAQGSSLSKLEEILYG